jgi:hypothetical protein
LVEYCADGVGCREEGEFACDTEVVSSGSMAYISFLSSGVDQFVEFTEVSDVDVRPDVGSCPSVLIQCYSSQLTLADDTSLSSI